MDNVNAEAIVRALARIEYPGVVDYSYGMASCGLCGEDENEYGSGPFKVTDLEFHRVECPWRLAKEWVAAQEDLTAIFKASINDLRRFHE